MNKVLVTFFTILKLFFLKLFHFRFFHFRGLEMFSASTSIVLNRTAFLSFGKRCVARRNVEFRIGGNGRLVIGDRTFFNSGCMVGVHEKVSIGDHCSFGPNVMIFDHDHNIHKFTQKDLDYKTSPIEIGNNVWVGANVVILRGASIGDNCVIGAGTIIKDIIPSGTIVYQKKELIMYPHS